MVVDALSRRHTLLNVLDTTYLDFDHIKKIYKDNIDFSHIYQECSKGGYMIVDLWKKYLCYGRNVVIYIKENNYVGRN